jgi:hypothetical protein
VAATLNTVSATPPKCIRATAPLISPEFTAWRAQLASASTSTIVVLGDSGKATQLVPPLRSDFTALRFSPDRKYALAQVSADSYDAAELGNSSLSY